MHNNFIRVSIFDERDAYKVRMMRREEFKAAGGISFKALDGMTTYVITSYKTKMWTRHLQPPNNGHAVKLNARGGLHYRPGVRDTRPPAHHAELKCRAHRTARRKARQMLTTVDPDGDYDARYNPGITYRQW